MIRRGRWGWLAAAGLVLAAVVVGLGAWAATAWRDPDAYFRAARAELDSHRPEDAARALQRLERLRPPTPFDRLLRAQVAEAREKPDEAVAELGAIPDAHPLAPVARILAGQVEVRRHRLRSAEGRFLAALTLEPRAVQAHRELSYIYNIQHRQADLDRSLNALSELDALTYEHLFHWSKTRNVVWKPDRDCEELAKFLAADPDDRLSRLALADGLNRLDRPAEAIAVLEPLGVDDSDARAQRARIALDRGDVDRVESILNAGPCDQAVLARLKGQLALMRGDSTEAVACYRRAAAADPTDRATLQGLGQALRRAGDEAAAEPYLAAARRHDAVTPLVAKAADHEAGEDPSLSAKLGAACEAAGRDSEARAWYKRALRRDPTDHALQQAVHRTGSRIDQAARMAVSRAG
jgi:predicted Zn-dependent protease